MITLKDIPLICLTLPEARERQIEVKKQFVKHDFKSYLFFPGYSATSEEVGAAYNNNSVKRYPSCFRCSQSDCGKDCNNILIPSQVAVVLGFKKIFEMIASGQDEFVLVCEDDIIIADYAGSVFLDDRIQSVLVDALNTPTVPFLLRLGSPTIPEYFSADALIPDVSLDDRIVMSNYGFIVNKSMAKLAALRFTVIDHTADVMLHNSLANKGNCYTLTPQLFHDRSWSSGEIPSAIHPKLNYVEHTLNRFGEQSEEYKAAVIALKRHRKKAYETEVAFIGSPRCGSHYLSALLIANGIDVAHEKLGTDGICAWQYAVYSENHPYISDIRSSNSFFVYPKKYFLYVRNPMRALPSLITENAQAPLSYKHRRNIILKSFGIDLDSYSCVIERAARSYIHWYELALKNPIMGVVRVEHAIEDLNSLGIFGNIADAVIDGVSSGKGKPYLGVVHENPILPESWLSKLAFDTRIRLELMAKQFGYHL